MSGEKCSQHVEHEHLWFKFKGKTGGMNMFIGNVLAKWAAAGGQLLPRIAMSSFSRTAAFWIPWRTPEASCPRKGADTAILGSGSGGFLRSNFRSTSHLQYKSHLDCRGDSCLILFFHCVVPVSTSTWRQTTPGFLLSRNCSRLVARGPVRHDFPFCFLNSA